MQQLAVLCLDGVDLCQVVFAARNQFSKLLVCLTDGTSWRGRGGGVSVSAGHWIEREGGVEDGGRHTYRLLLLLLHRGVGLQLRYFRGQQVVDLQRRRQCVSAVPATLSSYSRPPYAQSRCLSLTSEGSSGFFGFTPAGAAPPPFFCGGGGGGVVCEDADSSGGRS